MSHMPQVVFAKRFVALIVSLILFSTPLHADDKHPPDDLLATLAREASAVVRVQVTGAETKQDGIYVEQTIECLIVEKYKGDLRAGGRLRYAVRSESGLEREAHGERIVFLSRRPKGEATPWAALETGEFAADVQLAAKVRRIVMPRKSMRRKSTKATSVKK